MEINVPKIIFYCEKLPNKSKCLKRVFAIDKVYVLLHFHENILSRG